MASGVPHKTSAPKRSSPVASPFMRSALLGRAEPALLRKIEDHAVGVLVLHLEVGVLLAFAEREEELAARRLDALLRLLEVLDLEAEVMRADEALGILQSGAGFAFVFEEREIDHAVAEIDRRAHVDVLLADALELEHTLVEARRALEIAHHHRYVPELRHGFSIDRPRRESSRACAARGASPRSRHRSWPARGEGATARHSRTH